MQILTTDARRSESDGAAVDSPHIIALITAFNDSDYRHLPRDPGLLYTPKQAGGVGLASVDVACKTQRVKQSMQWLIQRKDTYFLAWKAWTWRGETTGQFTGLTPRLSRRGQRGSSNKSAGGKLHQLLGEWIAPPTANEGTSESMMKTLKSLEKGSVSWATEDEWIIELPSQQTWKPRQQDKEQAAFWPTYSWEGNPWIRDATGNMLKRNKFTRIRPCRLEELQMRRTAVNRYTMNIPTMAGKMHRQDKMRKWGLAILLSSPVMEIGDGLAIQSKLQMRHPTKLEAIYQWEATTSGHAVGISTNHATGDHHKIELVQQPDGIHWKVDEGQEDDERTCRDIQHLHRHAEEGSIVFYAHPLLHGFPWKVPDSIANKHVCKALKKQPFKKYCGDGPSLKGQLERLAQTVQNSKWQEAVMQQTPTQVWQHSHELTAYQVWVGYRVATRQLNLYHEDRARDNSYRKLQCCNGIKETIEHIFWSCPAAQACWQKLIGHWMEEKWSGKQLELVMANCANRKAPSMSAVTAVRLRKEYPDTEEEIVTQWKRLWRIMSSVCITMLWMQRNRVIFQHEEIKLEQSTQEFWATGLRQVKALAKRERRRPDMILEGPGCFYAVQLLKNHHESSLQEGQAPYNHRTRMRNRRC